MKKHIPILIAISLLAVVLFSSACRTANDAEARREAAPPEPQEVQIKEARHPPLTGLKWVLPEKYARLEGGKLIVDIPASDYPADAMAEAELPASLCAGAKGFSISVSAEGADLAKPTKAYLGLKFQIHVVDKSTGLERWPNCPKELGSFAKVLRNDAALPRAAKPCDNHLW